MKPAWDQLMDEFKDSTTALVADVDCTVEEELCSQQGVEGYPTIKYGDPAALQDYQGGRELEDMQEFAKSNLGPTCGPKNLDLCDDAQKKEIESLTALTDDDLKTKIADKEKAIADLDTKFNEDVEKLQKQYEEMQKAKDAGVAEIKKSGLAMMKTLCDERPNCKPPPPPPGANKDAGEDKDEDYPEDGEEPTDEEPPEDDSAPEDKKDDL